MNGPCPVAASSLVLPAPPFLLWGSFVAGTGHQCGWTGRIWSVSPRPAFHDALVPSNSKHP